MMSNPSDVQLRLYAAGLLDPSDALELKEGLQASASLRRRLAGLLPMTPIDEKPADSWRIPPPGLSWKLSAVRPGVMGQAALRIGERFQLRLPSHDGSDSLVVVLRRAEDRWEVIAPTSPETMLRLSQLRRSSSGERVLDLLAQRPVGIQRWAVVLLTSDAGIHWDLSDAERWREVQAAVGRGTLPVASVQITVKA